VQIIVMDYNAFIDTSALANGVCCCWCV